MKRAKFKIEYEDGLTIEFVAFIHVIERSTSFDVDTRPEELKEFRELKMPPPPKLEIEGYSHGVIIVREK